MLLIDLAELIRTVGKHIEVDIDEFPKPDPDAVYVEPAVGTITITNSGAVVLVRGRIKTVIEMECGRCVTPFRQLIDAEIEEQYSLLETENPRYSETQAAIVDDEDNELPEDLLDGTVMDLNVVIRQAVILASPLRPLCKPDCLGLCTICGKDRNDPNSACDCALQIRYTPLASLKELLQDELGAGNEVKNGADAKSPYAES